MTFDIQWDQRYDVLVSKLRLVPKLYASVLFEDPLQAWPITKVYNAIEDQYNEI